VFVVILLLNFVDLGVVLLVVGLLVKDILMFDLFEVVFKTSSELVAVDVVEFVIVLEASSSIFISLSINFLSVTNLVVFNDLN